MLHLMAIQAHHVNRLRVSTLPALDHKARTSIPAPRRCDMSTRASSRHALSVSRPDGQLGYVCRVRAYVWRGYVRVQCVIPVPAYM